MTSPAPDGLLERDLRANPRLELVLLDRLSPAERGALGALAADPDLYGVLRPAAGGAGAVRTVDRETALLWLTLREPGPAPAYLRAVLGEAALRTVARLVADGLLEVEDGGRFVHGAAALGLLGTGEGAGGGRLAALADEALRHAAALAVDDPLALSLRLYGFNRLPLTPRWRRRLATAMAVEGFLGIAAGGIHRRPLDRDWSPASRSADWWSWRNRHPAATAKERDGGATWKLYVSAPPDALAEGFGRVVEALAAARAAQFKVGADAWGLLRPDKVVAYFRSFERLAAAAAELDSRLAGLPAQGVPFTAEIGGGGLLSWGVDPPEGGEGAGPGAAPSWRLWLTHRLARALLDARAAGAGEPWGFALARVALEGVDTATWTPGARLWSGAGRG